mmetsp:Transcript_480/g.781  ORF Transcript_480/g.781 Transcript_480/m.781 type:complete len:564 (+) Transcript_480:18-1709(+)
MSENTSNNAPSQQHLSISGSHEQIGLQQKKPGMVTESTSAADYRVFTLTYKHMDLVMTDLQELATEAPWHSNGYFDTFQHDRIEGLFFRFLVCRHVLMELAHRLNLSGDEAIHHSRDNGGDESIAKAKSTMVSFAAGMCITLYDTKLVLAFQNDKTAVSKLNEAFYRSSIPQGTYRKMFLDATNETKLQSLSKALLLYTEEAKTTDTLTSELISGDEQDHAEYEKLFQNIHTHVTEADALISELIHGNRSSSFLPSLNNRIRHSKAAELTRLSADKESRMICRSRALLFRSVSRIKSPTAHLIRFSDDQKVQVFNKLQPGDIVLTYTAGYMSDVFIPGAFKHGITYVGSVQERKGAGLVAENIPKTLEIPDSMEVHEFDVVEKVSKEIDAEREELLLSFETSKVSSSGQDADVIEAVAEGVIFNNLRHLMDTHINRMLVLRPQISSEERVKALTTVFRFLGAAYDFGFNFADESNVVCTEVIYKALNGKGLLDFQLVQRAGHPTLSADDVVETYLASPNTFEFVLLAEEDPKSLQHEAAILSGDAGEARLSELMAAQKKTFAK